MSKREIPLGPIPEGMLPGKTKKPFCNSKKKREALFKENPNCHWCGKRLTSDECTLEHVTPSGEGGNNDMGNLALSCARYNHDREKAGALMCGFEGPIYQAPKIEDMDPQKVRQIAVSLKKRLGHIAKLSESTSGVRRPNRMRSSEYIIRVITGLVARIAELEERLGDAVDRSVMVKTPSLGDRRITKADEEDDQLMDERRQSLKDQESAQEQELEELLEKLDETQDWGQGEEESENVATQ